MPPSTIRRHIRRPPPTQAAPRGLRRWRTRRVRRTWHALPAPRSRRAPGAGQAQGPAVASPRLTLGPASRPGRPRRRRAPWRAWPTCRPMRRFRACRTRSRHGQVMGTHAGRAAVRCPHTQPSARRGQPLGPTPGQRPLARPPAPAPICSLQPHRPHPRSTPAPAPGGHRAPLLRQCTSAPARRGRHAAPLLRRSRPRAARQAARPSRACSTMRPRRAWRPDCPEAGQPLRTTPRRPRPTPVEAAFPVPSRPPRLALRSGRRRRPARPQLQRGARPHAPARRPHQSAPHRHRHQHQCPPARLRRPPGPRPHPVAPHWHRHRHPLAPRRHPPARRQHRHPRAPHWHPPARQRRRRPLRAARRRTPLPARLPARSRKAALRGHPAAPRQGTPPLPAPRQPR
jgi:hypothetical protein